MTSKIAGNSIACSMASACQKKREYQSSALLTLCEGNHWFLDSPLKVPVMRKEFLCRDVIMFISSYLHGRVDIKIPSYHWIPIIETRRSHDRLIFIMAVPIPGKTVFYIELPAKPVTIFHSPFRSAARILVSKLSGKRSCPTFVARISRSCRISVRGLGSPWLKEAKIMGDITMTSYDS